MDVQEFHEALEIPVGNYAVPRLSRHELRAELIREEAKETIQAIEDDDIIGAIDGLCDIIVVTYGAAVEWGVNLGPFWMEVHRSNMAKKGGPTRADGKKLKPEGWTPPDIAGVLYTLRMSQHIDGCSFTAGHGWRCAPGCPLS